METNNRVTLDSMVLNDCLFGLEDMALTLLAETYGPRFIFLDQFQIRVWVHKYLYRRHRATRAAHFYLYTLLLQKPLLDHNLHIRRVFAHQCHRFRLGHCGK